MSNDNPLHRKEEKDNLNHCFSKPKFPLGSCYTLIIHTVLIREFNKQHLLFLYENIVTEYALIAILTERRSSNFSTASFNF